MNNSVKIISITCLILALCFCCACLGLALAAGGAWMVDPNQLGLFVSSPTPVALMETPVEVEATPTPEEIPTETLVVEVPTATDEPTATEDPTPTQPDPQPASAENTLALLENTFIPIADPIKITERFKHIDFISPTVAPNRKPVAVGDRDTFWVTNVDTNESSQVAAVMRYKTDHLYFWVQDSISYNDTELRKLADTFETKIYPTDREFFGSEWTPGIDGDPHLYVLYAKNLGDTLAGYFSSSDEYPPVVNEFSNGHEMFFLNADNERLSSKDTYGTMAHEFQHMIHWYRDSHEDTWMDEGFAVLAEFLNHYPIYFDTTFVQNPDMQLNDWPDSPDQREAHYGGSFLFLNYFLDRFGENATKALVADQENGLDSIDQTLKQLNIIDPLSNKLVTADDVFADWAVTNYLQNPDVGDGRFTYKNYPDVPTVKKAETLRTCPHNLQSRDVHQYGTDYIRITCQGSYSLHFQGAFEVPILPSDPHSGQYAFWSNAGDKSDMTLTGAFDFTDQTGPLSLDYWAWYDLEQDFDYVYLEASTDGKNWQILKTPSSTGRDVTGNAFGWGYNGHSGGGDTSTWLHETVDLSKFAGQQVQIRFEYITDAGVHNAGFLLDDVSIPEINYHTDFENEDSRWQADGFARISNAVPQTYRLEMISYGDGKVTVQPIELSSTSSADIPFTLGQGVNEIVLVVSGTARFTRQKAIYSFEVK